MKKLLPILLSAFATVGQKATAKILYVDASTTCFANGSSWAVAEKAMQSYPNPATDFITFAADGGTPKMIMLRNLLGATLREAKPTGRISSMPVAGLPTSTYMLEISAGAERTVRRVIVR